MFGEVLFKGLNSVGVSLWKSSCKKAKKGLASGRGPYYVARSPLLIMGKGEKALRHVRDKIDN